MQKILHQKILKKNFNTGSYSYECIFCKNECHKLNEYKEISTVVVSVKCEKCNARFVVEPNSNYLLECKIFCKINGVSYCAQFTYDDVSKSIFGSKFKLYKFMLNSKIIEQTVLKLGYYPDITPTNISNRIPTLITFM
jgi:hypothetical protein